MLATIRAAIAVARSVSQLMGPSPTQPEQRVGQADRRVVHEPPCVADDHAGHYPWDEEDRDQDGALACPTVCRARARPVPSASDPSMVPRVKTAVTDRDADE